MHDISLNNSAFKDINKFYPKGLELTETTESNDGWPQLSYRPCAINKNKVSKS